MNPQYLPPQQNNFNSTANGFPPRPPINPKNGPTAPNSALPPNSAPPLGYTQPSMPGYPSAGMPQKNLQHSNAAADAYWGDMDNGESQLRGGQSPTNPQFMSTKPVASFPAMPPSNIHGMGPPKQLPMPGQMPPQQPPLSGQMPPVPHQNTSPMQAQHLPSPGQMTQQQPPLQPGQHHSISKQTVHMPSQQPPFVGQMAHQQKPSLPGQMAHQQQPPQPGQMPPMSGQIQQNPPNMPPIPGQMPQQQHPPPKPGQMPPVPGQMQPNAHMPPLPGQMPHQQLPRPGQMPPMPGQVHQNSPHMPPQLSSQMSSLPGQISSPQPGQMPPMSGHMHQNPPHMPPLPGQQPPMPQQGPGQMPSMPGQRPQMNTNQMTNQMQNMSIGTHMAPPLSGAGYMPPSRPGFSGPMGYQPQPQQEQKRLDPDQMPSAIQVIEEDKANRSGVFVTNQKGLVPPLVTTDFTVQDQGNASPRFIRSTMYNVPISQDMMKQTAVPFSLVLNPMAKLGKDEYPPPIVNFGELGPVRCVRCKAYMCPFMQFIDSGRRFQCLFCKATTDVPAEYFQHLDHTGQRMDKYERPELVLGTYEFVATADYCRNNVLPKPPAIIFVIDVSYNNIKSGLVNLLCGRMKEIIQNLPVDQGQDKSNMKVGFITYNSSVHFYNIKGTLAGPQMMVVGDTQEMFMPLLDGFLCTPEESEGVIDALMEQIPQMFADTKETEIVLLPAILAGLEALKASETTGKLVVFHSTLPTAECPGKLKNRDDRKLLGTEKERTVLTPQTQAYNQLGQDCVAAGCSVDLFVLNNSYIDIATISQVSRLTGGEVFKYTYFQAEVDGDRLINDVIMDISRPIAFDGIMRVRTSTGIRPTDFYGYFYMSNTTDMELAALDCDKGVAIEIKHDDKLNEDEGVYIQAALLYTSCSGQRRLRIMNISLKTCSQLADLYRSCDLDTLINYLSKQAAYKLLENSPKQIKDNLVSRAAQILACYRKNCATPSSAGQLILPECMKLLPLYMNCLLKSDAISGGSDMTIDDRSFAMQVVLTMDVSTSVHHFYPRLIPVHDLDPTSEKTPSPIRCTIEKMSEQGVYILENGIHMFLWVGLGASPDFVQSVFGVQASMQIDVEQPFLPELDNPLSIAVRRIIEEIRVDRHRNLRLTIVRQKEKLEPVFKHFLVEDRGADGSASYVDFLCHMHKEIRSLLS